MRQQSGTHLTCHHKGSELDHILRDRHASCSQNVVAVAALRLGTFRARSQDVVLALSMCCGCGAQRFRNRVAFQTSMQGPQLGSSRRLGSVLWGGATVSHAQERVVGFLQFIRSILFVYTAALSTDDRGDNDGPGRGVDSSSQVVQVVQVVRVAQDRRNHAAYKAPSPLAGHRGQLNTFHSAVLSVQCCFCGSSGGASCRLLADFLLGFA